MSWGISENASDKEKLKADINDYFYSLCSVGKIDYQLYEDLYDACMLIIDEGYDRFQKEMKALGETE